MDFKRAEKETVDPTYLWIGPNEKQLTGKLFDLRIIFNDMNIILEKHCCLLEWTNWNLILTAVSLAPYPDKSCYILICGLFSLYAKTEAVIFVLYFPELYYFKSFYET